MDRRTEDLRVLRTHTLLLRALSDLLQEKPFDEIGSRTSVSGPWSTAPPSMPTSRTSATC